MFKENQYIQVMEQALDIAHNNHDNHLTIFRFTTNWKAGFGTITERSDIENMITGKTLEETLLRLIAKDSLNNDTYHITKKTIKHIKDTFKIELLAKEFIPSLKKGMHLFRGLCPFHKETMPSFTINPSKQLFYCFGCDQGGDVIEFIMKVKNMSFNQAIKWFIDFEKKHVHKEAN